MEIELKVTKTVDVKTIAVEAGVRYWEDAIINGVADEDGTLTPFAKGNLWKPRIDIDNGTILDWPKGTTAEIHFKVCDQCSYKLLDEKGEVVYTAEERYVPKILCPKDAGYGDYIIMNIDADGKIANWDASELENAIGEDDG